MLQDKGVVDTQATVIVLEDTVEGLGSGGATLNALLVVAERICVIKGLNDLNADVLSDIKILIIHLGRYMDCAHTNSGLLDLPLSCITSKNFQVTINPLIHIYLLIKQLVLTKIPLERYSVWVYGCDHLISPDINHIIIDTKEKCDIVALSAQLPIYRAKGHAIYTFKENTNILENISLGNDVVGGDGEGRSIVLGLVCFTESVAEHLLRLSLIPPIHRSTYMGIDTGSSGLKLSLFFDFLLPTCDGLTVEDYVGGSPGAINQSIFVSSRTHSFDKVDCGNALAVRKALWNELSHLKTKIVPVSTPFLYHASINCLNQLEQDIDLFTSRINIDGLGYTRLPIKLIPWLNPPNSSTNDNCGWDPYWLSVVENVLLNDLHSSLLPIFKSFVLDGKSVNLLAHLHKIACLRAVSNPNIGRIFCSISDVLALEAGPEGGLRSGPALNPAWKGPFTLLEAGDLEAGILALGRIREDHKLSSPLQLTRLARHYESAAQICIRKVVSTVKQHVKISRGLKENANEWTEFDCAARIDVAGGWSDTPPITYEYGGAVFNIAIKIDGKRPVGARCRATRSGGILCRLISLSETTQVYFGHLGDICYSVPSAPGALVCACLVCAGVLDLSKDNTLEEQLRVSFGGECEGLQLECWSNLPHGSGMGTSSILAGCILTVIWKTMGCQFDQSSLLHAQLLTTGGGWQDQVGGLVPGLKLGTFTKSVDCPKIEVERVDISEDSIKLLGDRLLLIYTGRTRLAKNLLQDVIRNWYGREAIILDTVKHLVENAQKCFTCAKNSDWEGLAECANIYREQKKIMASGSEPRLVTRLLNVLQERNLISAGWLAGAGGGGFLYLITKPGASMNCIQSVLSELCLTESSFQSMTVHSVSIEI